MTDGRLLDLFPMGVVTLDAEARVRAANQRARRILSAGDGLQLGGGRVVASRRDDAATLERFFAGACPHGIVGGLHARGAMQITRESDRGKLTLLVADAHGWPGAPASEFVLFLQEPEVSVVVSEATLRALHGLTRTEAKITAVLVRGSTVTSIAAGVGTSANTIRTHLKRVFGKLGVASQSALIRVVLSGPAALQLDSERPPSRGTSPARRLRGTDRAVP